MRKQRYTPTDEQVAAIKKLAQVKALAAKNLAPLFSVETITVYKYMSGENRADVEPAELDEALITLAETLVDRIPSELLHD